MNPALVRKAVDNIRKVVQEKGRYRRLLTSEIVDVEIYLQQILVEVALPPTPLWRHIVEKIKGAH